MVERTTTRHSERSDAESKDAVELPQPFAAGCLDYARHDSALMSFVRMRLSILLAVLLTPAIFAADEKKEEKPVFIPKIIGT